MMEQQYTCFLDDEPIWSCEDLGELLAHVQHYLDDVLMAAVGGGNIFQGKALHNGVGYLIAIRDTTEAQQQTGDGDKGE